MQIVKDYYAILETHLNATQEEIKRAWREQLQVWHPDRFTSNPTLQKKATEKTKSINEAYEVLSDTGKRQAYDSERQSSKDFRSDPVKNRTEDKIVTDCPNPICGTKLRVPHASERIKVSCPECRWSFTFDAGRGVKEDVRSGHDLPEFEIRRLLSLKGASPQLLAAFVELAQQVLRARSHKMEVRVTKDFVPFSLKTVEQPRNFADIISVSGVRIDLALKTGEPHYSFSDSQGMTRPIRSQAKKFRFGSFQREVPLQKKEDVPYIRDLVLQCCDNLSRRLDF